LGLVVEGFEVDFSFSHHILDVPNALCFGECGDSFGGGHFPVYETGEAYLRLND
jgi:hypothetical protein